MSIILDRFTGLVPRLSNRKIPDTAGQTATNCEFSNGTIQPIDELGSNLHDGGETIYLDNGTWRNWGEIRHVVPSPVSDTRIIYTDGVEPKIRDGATEYPLAVPAPIAGPGAESRAKTSSPIVYTWYYFYEEPDGSKADAASLPTPPAATVVAKVYTLESGDIPAKVAASADARFIMWATLEDTDGNYLGKVVPSPAYSSSDTDAQFAGALIQGDLVVGTDATLTFSYVSTYASTYTISRYYVMTFIRDWGDGGIDESAPSPVSNEVLVDPSQDAYLDTFSSIPSGYGITGMRIYRTETGESGETDYFFVAEITPATSNFLDTAASSTVVLNNILDTSGYDEPDDELEGVRYHPGGFLVAFKGKYLYCSKPYAPHLWGRDFYPVDHAIQGLGVVEQSIAVLTSGHPVWFTGSAPNALVPDRVRKNLACRSAQSIVITDTSVVYASTRGAIEISPGGTANLTDSLYTGDQWNDLDPSNMIFAYQNSRLFMFMSDKLRILRLDNGAMDLSEVEQTAESVFVDPETDRLYLSSNYSIYEWGAGSNRTYTFKSKTFVAPKVWCPSVVRVSRASEGSFILRLYANGVLNFEREIDPGSHTWLPEMSRAKLWAFEVESNRSLYDIMLLEEMP